MEKKGEMQVERKRGRDGWILILIFAEALALYGLIVGLILSTKVH